MQQKLEIDNLFFNQELMKIRNKTKEEVAVMGLPVFGALEEREVTEEVGQLLLRNHNFEELTAKPKAKKVVVEDKD